MLLSIITCSFVRRRRDYASVMQVVADHYEVTVTSASIHRARRILGPQAAPEAAATPVAEEQPSAAEPPRYGERVTDAEQRPPADDPADDEPSADR
jgi:hypothetical protein